TSSAIDSGPAAITADPLLNALADNGGPTKTMALQHASPARNAAGVQQQVRVAGSSGTFTLTFKGATTGLLAFNATANEVQTALNLLPTIGGVGGTVT